MSGPNAELAYKVLDYIDAHPEQWDQDEWCGTAQCFAGWAVSLSIGNPEFAFNFGGLHISTHAARALGFESRRVMENFAAKMQVDAGNVDEYGDPMYTYDLFDAGNTRQQLGDMVAEIFGPRPGGPS